MSSLPIGILFAAGESKRLGQPKQLISYNGKPLVAYIAQTFLKAFPYAKLIVVTGANSEAVEETLKNISATTVFNPNWSEGISSSIREAKRYIDSTLSELEKLSTLFLLLACDQYLLDEHHLRDLWGKSLSTKQPVFTRYTQEDWGIPCCVGWRLLETSEKLSANKGLKALLKGSLGNLSFVDNPKLSLDLDTPEDLQRISKKDQ